MGVRSGLERRRSTRRITRVAAAYLIQKPRKVNIQSLFLQLFMPSPRPDVSVRGKEHLNYSVWKYGRAHVSAISDQAGWPPEGVLFAQQCLPNRGDGGDAGGGVSGFFGAKRIANVLLPDKDRDLTIRFRSKRDVKRLRDPRERLHIREIDTRAGGHETDAAVKRAAVKKVPTESRSEQQPDRSLTRTARAIDRNNRWVRGARHVQGLSFPRKRE